MVSTSFAVNHLNPSHGQGSESVGSNSNGPSSTGNVVQLDSDRLIATFLGKEYSHALLDYFDYFESSI